MSAENKRPTAVLVDAYLSGNYLPPAFAKLEVDVVHVQSTPELMGSMLPPDLSVYVDNIIHSDPAQTAARLSQYAPVCVVPGMEPGVELADELSELLGLATNGTTLSPARRDKYQMIETLRAAGIRCAEQFKGRDPDALVAWAERRRRYPVVVKPLRSAATDNVSICHGPAHVRQAAATVLTSQDIYGRANTEVLVQSYLAGNEYVVNMVSYDGMRYTSDVWQYHKKLVGSTHRVYDTEHLLPSDARPVPELITYVVAALDALGIRFGPTHAEVMMTPEGPALVEIGARVSGHLHPRFHDTCAGGNQADLTALAYVRPEKFLQRYGGKVYRKRQEAVCYLTPTSLAGTVEGIDDAVLDEIRGLPTVHDLNLKVKAGDRIKPTIDLYSSTMRIFMAAASDRELRRDYARIQELKDKVFRLDGGPARLPTGLPRGRSWPG